MAALETQLSSIRNDLSTAQKSNADIEAEVASIRKNNETLQN